VDERVDEKVEQSLSARLAVIERAIADLDREIKELQRKSTS
jgi:predicted transcriptional regulator